MTEGNDTLRESWQLLPVKEFWSLTLFNEHHLFHPNALNRSSSARRAITQLSHAIILSTGRRFIDVAI